MRRNQHDQPAEQSDPGDCLRRTSCASGRPACLASDQFIHFVRRIRLILGIVWALPCSVIGALLAVVVLARGGRVKKVGRVCEVAVMHGNAKGNRFITRLPFSAITFGHVVLGRSEDELVRLRRHELAHVAQFERWGVLLFVLYPLASLVSYCKGRGWYQGNSFEVQARMAEVSEG